MHIPDAERLARSLMREHGLAGWTFQWDRAVRRAGSCRHGSQRITLSRALMAGWSEREVRNTVLHEIAHALVGPGHGHDRAWRKQARRIGCTGDRCWTPSASAPDVAPRWIGVCQGCGVKVRRHRRTHGARHATCAKRRGRNADVLWYDTRVAA